MRTPRSLVLALLPTLIPVLASLGCSDAGGSSPMEMPDDRDAAEPSTTNDAGGDEPAPTDTDPEPDEPIEPVDTDDPVGPIDTDDAGGPAVTPTPPSDAGADSGVAPNTPSSSDAGDGGSPSPLPDGDAASDAGPPLDACARACAAAAAAGCGDNAQCEAELCYIRDIDSSCSVEADAYLDCVGNAAPEDFVCSEADRPQYVAESCNDPHFDAWLTCLE